MFPSSDSSNFSSPMIYIYDSNIARAPWPVCSRMDIFSSDVWRWKHLLTMEQSDWLKPIIEHMKTRFCIDFYFIRCDVWNRDEFNSNSVEFNATKGIRCVHLVELISYVDANWKPISFWFHTVALCRIKCGHSFFHPDFFNSTRRNSSV